MFPPVTINYLYQHLWVTLAFSFHISGTDKQLCYFLFMFSVLCWGHHLLFHVFGWGNYQSIVEKIRLLQKFQCSVFAESLMFFQSPHRAWLLFHTWLPLYYSNQVICTFQILPVNFSGLLGFKNWSTRRIHERF